MLLKAALCLGIDAFKMPLLALCCIGEVLDGHVLPLVAGVKIISEALCYELRNR